MNRVSVKRFPTFFLKLSRFISIIASFDQRQLFSLLAYSGDFDQQTSMIEEAFLVQIPTDSALFQSQLLPNWQILRAVNIKQFLA